MSKNRSGLEDSFCNGCFWELYRDLEHQFRSFLEYVPYLPGNEKTYSFKLLNLILSIGGHVDSAFKQMAEYPDFAYDGDCQEIAKLVKKSEENVRKGKGPITVKISLPLKAFDDLYGISEERILFKRLPKREFVQPFLPHNPKTDAPEWWETYNGLKHHLSRHIKNANLVNALNALAGAFLLNVRHIPAMKRLYDFGLLKVAWTDKFVGKRARDEWPEADFLECIKSVAFVQKSPFFIETPIFLYYYARGEDNDE
jgi:hypothetical protein